MTPYLSLIKDPIPCQVNIKVADGKVISKETVVGRLNATVQEGGRLIRPPEVNTYGSRELAYTLLSQPQLCKDGGMIHVASENHGYWCQRDTRG